MKKFNLIILLGLTILLLGFIVAAQGNGNGNSNNNNSQNDEDENETNDDSNDACTGNCTQERDRIRNFTKSQIKDLIQEKNRLKFENKTGENCTEGCVCQGVVMRCDLGNGTRQMTVYSQSGNKIIITKTANASTTVELYKSNGTLVGVFEGNKTKQIKMTPEQVREKIQERLQSRLQDENITLDKDGYYKYNANKIARFLGLFKVKEKIQFSIDPETGEITRTRTSWWGFLARDINEQLILGASCGTVTPGYNDECCQNKGYDSWNNQTSECVFNAVE